MMRESDELKTRDENLEWVGLENIQIGASMSAGGTLGRHKLTSRFTPSASHQNPTEVYSMGVALRTAFLELDWAFPKRNTVQEQIHTRLQQNIF